MKAFFSEYMADYPGYTFSWAVYCLKEAQSELPEIYARGFLPYTARVGYEPELYYLARSLRVDLELFADTSENRRVDRRMADLAPALDAVPIRAFDRADSRFRAFCCAYADERFRGGAMDAARFDYLLGRESLTHILTFRQTRDSAAPPLGYVFLAREGEMAHYWFAFFDTAYLRSHSLGKWMMWRTLRWAKEEGLRHLYLGTCYTSRALYKVKDHTGVEFFDGCGWNRDLDLLERLCARDESPEPQAADLFKLPLGAPERSAFRWLENDP